MKKLKLKALDLGASELLSREQLKNVLGGDGSGGNPNCRIGSCSLYVQALGQTIPGQCSYVNTSQYSWYCVCNAQGYQTNNGGTGCNYN